MAHAALVGRAAGRRHHRLGDVLGHRTASRPRGEPAIGAHGTSVAVQGGGVLDGERQGGARADPLPRHGQRRGLAGHRAQAGGELLVDCHLGRPGLEDDGGRRAAHRSGHGAAGLDQRPAAHDLLGCGHGVIFVGPAALLHTGGPSLTTAGHPW